MSVVTVYIAVALEMTDDATMIISVTIDTTMFTEAADGTVIDATQAIVIVVMVVAAIISTTITVTILAVIVADARTTLSCLGLISLKIANM